MSNKLFEQQVNVFLQYLEELWQRTDELPRKKATQPEIEKFPTTQKSVLRESLTGLKNSLGDLQVVVEELYQQNHELTVAKASAEVESRHYQELFEYAPDACLVTTKEGNLLEANQKAIQLLNISPKRLFGKPLVIFIAAEERQIFYSKINQLQKGESIQNWQVKIQRQRGIGFTTSITVSPILNQEGDLEKLRWRILEPVSPSNPNSTLPQDINNERELVEKSSPVFDSKLLQEPTNHLEALTEQLPITIEKIGSIFDSLFSVTHDFFLICDNTGKFIYANPVAEQILQLSQKDLIGKSWHQLNFPSEGVKQIEAQQKQLLAKEQINDQVDISTKEGVKTYQYTITKISQIPRYPEAIIITFKEIARQKQPKNNASISPPPKKDSNLTKSHFTSIFIAKLRNPLNHILACNKLLESDLQKQLNPKQTLYLQGLQINIKRMHQLLEDLSLMNRIEIGKVQLKPSLIDLTEFCRRLIEELQEGIDSQHKITLIKQGKPCGVWDEKLLRQTLSNLLISAIKYSPNGSEVELEVVCQGKQVIFNIQNDNSEISQKEKDLILEALNQNQETNSNVIEEEVLRLMIAKECVKIQKGNLFLEWKDTRTVFTVKLPLNQRVEKKNKEYKAES
jgi:PAS domain S-box-containing protein